MVDIWLQIDRLTLLLFSMSARSHTATSVANWLNSRTWVSNSVVQRFTISSIVLPLRMDGGGTDIAVDVIDVDAAGATKPYY